MPDPCLDRHPLLSGEIPSWSDEQMPARSMADGFHELTGIQSVTEVL